MCEAYPCGTDYHIYNTPCAMELEANSGPKDTYFETNRAIEGESEEENLRTIKCTLLE